MELGFAECLIKVETRMKCGLAESSLTAAWLHSVRLDSVVSVSVCLCVKFIQVLSPPCACAALSSEHTAHGQQTKDNNNFHIP